MEKYQKLDEKLGLETDTFCCNKLHTFNRVEMGNSAREQNQ